jgi:hypothetical protein
MGRNLPGGKNTTLTERRATKAVFESLCDRNTTLAAPKLGPCGVLAAAEA